MKKKSKFLSLTALCLLLFLKKIKSEFKCHIASKIQFRYNTYRKVASSRLSLLYRSTPKHFQTVYEGQIWCLCTGNNYSRKYRIPVGGMICLFQIFILCLKSAIDFFIGKHPWSYFLAKKSDGSMSNYSSSANSFRGNYSFLKVKNVEIFI